MNLPPIQTFYHGLTVCYFEHNGKVAIWKEKDGKREYTWWEGEYGWMNKEDFYNL